MAARSFENCIYLKQLSFINIDIICVTLRTVVTSRETTIWWQYHLKIIIKLPKRFLKYQQNTEWKRGKSNWRKSRERGNEQIQMQPIRNKNIWIWEMKCYLWFGYERCSCYAIFRRKNEEKQKENKWLYG